MEFLHIGGHGIGVQHVVAQAVQHLLFIDVRLDRSVVGAAATVAVLAAGPLIAADDDPAAAAYAAFADARQQPLGAARLFGAVGAVSVAQQLHRVPCAVVDDAQFRCVGLDPVRLRVGADAFLAGARVGDLAGPFVDDLADVDPVLQDAVLALAIAADRRGPPCAAGGAGDAIIVQSRGDLAGASMTRIFGEDPADDFGLVVIDAAQAAHQFAAVVKPIGLAIAIGEAGGRSAAAHGAALAALHVEGDIFPRLRVEEALHPSLDLVDLTLGHGEEADAEIGQLVANGEAVALVASDSAGRFGKHLVDAAALDAGQKGIEAGALILADAGGAADRFVGEGVDDLPAFMGGAIAA